MRAYPKRRNLLFQSKNTNKQSVHSHSGQREDEQYNIVEGGRMHSREVEVADLVGEHLQT
jgi:hypothetical protein